MVAPHAGGVVPKFERTNIEPAHDRLAAEMRAVYLASDVPPYIDAEAKILLAEGRNVFRDLNLSVKSLVEEDRDLHVFLWRGSQANAVFGAALAMAGLPAESHDFGVTISKTKLAEGEPLLQKLGEMESLTSTEVADFVENIRVGKFADFVPESLAREQWARQNADLVKEIPTMALAARQ
jgi:ATP-dependent helicase Lhr and Lhr-like helicase